MESVGNQMRLSIIVPVYNVEKYIERCLRSLLDQDIPKSDYEIIVVDDGTPDRSADIAQSFAKENDNIIVVHRKNGGLSAARNTGLEYVHGQYVFFVDSDDYIEPNVLSSLLISAESRNLDLLAFSTCRRRKDNGINWLHTFNDFIKDDKVDDGITLVRKGFLPTSVWTNLYRTETLNRYSFRFYEGIIHEDIEFNYRVFVKFNRIGAIDLLVYNYCENEGFSITQGRTPKQEVYALMSNMEVAASIKAFIRNENIPQDIFNRFDSIMNSLVVSICYSLLTSHRSLPYADKKMFVEKMCSRKLLPISGQTNSRKSDMFALLLKPKILKFAIKVMV